MSKSISTIIACGLTAAIAGTAGWALRGAAAMPRDAAQRAGHAPQPRRPVGEPHEPAPLIAVLPGGNVTLHVERRPVRWVLEQLALQADRPYSNYSAGADVPVGEVAARADCAEPAVDPARMLRTIAHGDDGERLDGLMHARHAGVFVPDDVLKLLYESDPSDRVRIAAFDIYLERHGGDSAAARQTLEAALVASSAAIQQRAQQALAELVERERIGAASPQGAPP